MKKLTSLMLGAAFSVATLFGMNGYAADRNVEILSIENNGNIISVKAINSLLDDTVMTIRVVKEEEGLSDNDKTYHYDQGKVGAGETVDFEFIISDERSGIPSAGKYVVSIQNFRRDRDEEIFYYADKASVESFLEKLKQAAEAVEKADEAYLVLMPLISEENAGAVEALGIEYNAFAAESDDVKKDTLNLFFEAGTAGLDLDEAAESLGSAYGLAVYNSGEYNRGLEMYSPAYGNEAMDKTKIAETVNKMKDKYSSTEDFRADLAVAYGIVMIDSAKVGNMQETLETFADETGECTEIAEKLGRLSATKKKTAYEYIVKEVNSNTETADELEVILEAAYKKASSGASAGGSGSGSGGGASGSSSNRVQSGGASVSAAQGSGTPDEKVNEKYIFTDLTSTHWSAEAVSALKSKGIVSGTDTGAFEPDRAVTREEFAKMLVEVCGFETNGFSVAFDDVDGEAWYAPYIWAASEKGIVMGIGDMKFGVGENIKRQDMAVMTVRAIDAVNMESAEIKDYVMFGDADEISDYAAESVKRLFRAGIINGKGGNLFDPLGTATRSEAAKIIYEAFVGGV